MQKNTFYLYLSITLLTIVTCLQTTLAQQPTMVEKQRWAKHAQQTNIIRDEWGIPHIYGKTDADAVFGLMYAQCEENFPQIEKNYLEMLGRTAELTGASVLWDDLMMRLIQDSVKAIEDYNRSPKWFQILLQAHADGINYYLAKHPQVNPAVITKFKPWYHLMWTDGSVSPTKTGGIKIKDLKNAYQQKETEVASNASMSIAAKTNAEIFGDYDMEEKTLRGSNGFAIAPKHSKNGNALLYINPHVPFYFRSEMHMISEEGLNAYGAVTWGQMFIYQGFNERLGWMHTSSYADVADIYEEKMKQVNGNWTYEYDNAILPVTTRAIQVQYKEEGIMKVKSFTTFKTIHGPVMGLNTENNKWLSLQENNRSLNALLECWTRTKANNLTEYKQALSLLANNSNNTVYADGDGNIAYWHGNFVPKRNPNYDYTLPVDGSIKATNWIGTHSLNEIVQSVNPENGWLQNCNATPYAVAGKNSPLEKNYPAYMAPDGENARGLNAVRLLEKIDKISLADLIQIGYNKHLTAFDILLPTFLDFAKNIALTAEEQKAINYLAAWNHDADTNSIATTLAVEWGTKWAAEIPAATTEEAGTKAILKYEHMVNDVSNHRKLQLLNATLLALKNIYGTWEMPWGAINRYQRVNPGERFNDSLASIAVAQTSSRWGQLPSFDSKRYPNTIKRYGFTGNSFIAAVSFGKKVEAKTIITGGQSRWANDKHFTDQAQKYIDGDFKTIHFYKADVLAHKATSYKPGFER